MKEAQQTQLVLHEITLRNVLSYGPESRTIPLRQLNVLIGPNGSGKSNLLPRMICVRSLVGVAG
jgi:predicted ATPase